MVTLKDIELNKQFYKQKIKNQNLVPYIDLLFEYNFKENIDVTKLINALYDLEEKKQIKPILKEILSKGKSKEIQIKKNNNHSYYEDDYLSPEHREALDKNDELVMSLYDIRLNALGIGTNKLKRRLNSIAKDDSIAMALRTAIEVEDKNIQAKKYTRQYRDKIYEEKKKLIDELIFLFKENNWIYGRQKSDVVKTSDIIFFEIPNCEQISFHTSLSNKSQIPIYEKEWDGLVNSTYDKLLKTVEVLYGERILNNKK